VIRTADIVLVGTNLENDGAYRLVRRIYEEDCTAQTLVIGHSETNQEIIPYLEAGGRGFFRRTNPIKELPENIRRIFRGEIVISPGLVVDIVTRLSELSRYIESVSQLPNQIACLTPREREILQLISRNYSNRDIANQLILEIGTVKNHVHNILSKLKVSNRREAARYLPFNTNRLWTGQQYPLYSWSPTSVVTTNSG
jgi:DNA-binding NarL/FixJ family response regulator